MSAQNIKHQDCMEVASEPFTGFTEFVSAIDEAVAGAQDCAEKCAALRRALCELIRSPSVKLPAAVHERIEDHYARRTLYHSAEHGYCIVAMTWGPGQGTPIHDHCGMWCVEGVWEGELEVIQYALLEKDGERYRFARAGCSQAGPGSAGSLIPPHEYHVIRNASDTQTAISVHVYAGELTDCATFIPTDEPDWYQRCTRHLSCD